MNRPIERENFLKILVAVQEFGTNSHRELIKLALKRKNLTFCELLDRNAHELYHLCFNSMCCQCGRIDRLPDVKSIHRDQYFKLFPEDQSKRLHGHITGKIYYKCCNYASTSVSPDNLDFGMAFTILLHCCKEFLWDCCLSAKQKTLQDFLNENKHDIFHMQVNSRACSLCNNGKMPTLKGSIGKADWDLLFKTSTGNDDPNFFSADQGITFGNLNSNLSYQLLLAFSEEIKSSKQLRKFRNHIAHHVSLRIKVEEFEQSWSEIETILIQLSNNFNGDVEMKEKLQQLKSEEDCKEKFEPLLADLKKEQELEDTLNVIYIDISYIRDHLCTKEDFENGLHEFFQQIQHLYEPRSSNEMQSKEMKIKGQAKGSSFTLDKSRLEFQPEKISDNTNFVKRIFKSIFGTAFTGKGKKERHEERYILKLRADDQTASTSVCDSTSFKGNPADEDIIHMENQAEEDNSESDTDDELRCGQCKEIYKSIEKFKKHKRSHKPKRRKEIFLKLTVDGIPDDQTREIIELKALNGTTVDGVEIVDADIGSLVIWTRMQTTVLQTKDKFLTTIEKVMKELFHKSPVHINQTVDVTIGITIADEYQDDYEDDEGDIFTCGVCLKKFFVLEAFERHKKSQCEKQSNTSPHCSTLHTSIADYETDEDNRCLRDECFEELSALKALQRHKLSFLRQPPTSDYETDEDNLPDKCFEELSTLEALQRHKPSFCRQQTGTSDYDTDEDNRCQCDICFEELSTLEALQRHKLSCCRQQTPTSGIDTTTVSLALYRYLCENIVGTKNHVKTIRLMNNIWDNMISSKHFVTIKSGCFGEGLLMKDSDLDVITVPKSIEVNAYEKKRLDPNIAYYRMVTDDVKPGFTYLLAENYGSTFSKCYEKFNGKLYLSSALLKHYLLRNRDTHKIHGPCISDKSGLIYDAMCLHCKTWIPQASQWISRSSNSWPSNDVKQSIIKHGVLFLPIGVKGSLKEDIEWRISFSVGEKMLMSTFTHTQLLCYALLKIVLKDVIAVNAECKDLLCSYYLKTIIFWLSEELPQSVWTPHNLIPCFMQCFSRLIYCVEYSACLHYFIPENNMFENRIEGRAREELLNRLYTLRSYDWRCVLFSDQLSEFIVVDHIEFYTLHTIEVKKSLDSEHLYWSNYMDFNIETCAYKKNLHRLLFFDKSAVKYLHAYYLSRWCAQYAQSISLSFTSSNKCQYNRYTSCLCTLLQNIQHDAVSGWLMLASLFYKSKQYNKALDILEYSLSKFTPEKIYRFMEMSDIHYRLLKLISFQKKPIVRLWKILLVDDIIFHENSWLIPDELQMEVISGKYFVSSIVYGYFLTFLCHFRLNNVRQCGESIQTLQFLIKEKYFIGKGKTFQSQAYNILRIASQLPWNHDAARQAVKKKRL